MGRRGRLMRLAAALASLAVESANAWRWCSLIQNARCCTGSARLGQHSAQRAAKSKAMSQGQSRSFCMDASTAPLHPTQQPATIGPSGGRNIGSRKSNSSLYHWIRTQEQDPTLDSDPVRRPSESAWVLEIGPQVTACLVVRLARVYLAKQRPVRETITKYLKPSVGHNTRHGADNQRCLRPLRCE